MTDIAGSEHWQKVWGSLGRLPKLHRLNYHHRRTGRLFASLVQPGGRVLDVGCGASRWLGFFQDTLQCETWGIDYSAVGVALAKAIIGPAGQERIVEGDLFDESLLPLASFDFIYSLGVIEHFSDGRVMTRRLAALLRPGGTVLTEVPNLLGPYGAAQRFFDPAVFEKHVLLGPRQLDELHVAEGLTPVRPAFYWGCFAPAVVAFGESRLGRGLTLASRVVQQFVCNALSAAHLDRESRLFSPQIVGIYRKGPAAAGMSPAAATSRSSGV